MAEQTVTILAVLKDAVTPVANRISAAFGAVRNVLTGLRTAAAPLTGIFATMTAGLSLVAGIRKAIAEAEQARLASDRLRVALQGDVYQMDRLKRFAAEAMGRTVLDDDQILATAEALIQRGVAIGDVQAALEATIQTSGALRLSLETSGEQIAQLYGGRVPRELAKAVPALRDLKEGAFDGAAAVAMLTDRFRGQAEMFAQTDMGRQAKAQRDIANAFEDLGEQLVPVKVRLMEALARALERFTAALDTPKVRRFIDALSNLGVAAVENADKIAAGWVGLKALDVGADVVQAGAHLKDFGKFLLWLLTTIISVKARVLLAWTAVAAVLAGGLLEIVKRITGIKIGILDVFDTARGAWERWREGNLGIGDFFAQLWADTEQFFRKLWLYLKGYLYDIPMAFLSGLFAWLMVKAEAVAASLKAKILAALSLIPGTGITGQQLKAAQTESNVKDEAAKNYQITGQAEKAYAELQAKLAAADAQYRGEQQKREQEAVAKGNAALLEQKKEAWAKEAAEALHARADLLRQLEALNARQGQQTAVADRDTQLAMLDELHSQMLISTQTYLDRRAALESGVLLKRQQELQEQIARAVALRREYEQGGNPNDPRQVIEAAKALSDQVAATRQLVELERQLAIGRAAIEQTRLREMGGLEGRFATAAINADRLADAGIINPQQAARRQQQALAEFRASVVATYAAIDGQLAEGLLSVDDAAALRARLGEISDTVEATASKAMQALYRFRDAAQGPLAGFFYDWMKGAKSVSEAVRDMMRGILDNMIRMLSEEASRIIFQWMLSSVRTFILGETLQTQAAQAGSTQRIALAQTEATAKVQAHAAAAGAGAAESQAATPIIGPLLALAAMAAIFAAVMALARFNTGGLVPGGGPNRDSVPAVLTPGEYVFSRTAVEAAGAQNLEAYHRSLLGIRGGGVMRTAAAAGAVDVQKLNAGGMVPAPSGGGDDAPQAVQAVVVADDPTFEKLLHGGKNAMLRFLADNGIYGR